MNRLLGCIDDINVPELRRTGRMIDISVGAAFYQPSDTYSFETLYKQADKSGYVSKKQPGTHITYYDDTVLDY
jgi:GGDEF domain-containing protein